MLVVISHLNGVAVPYLHPGTGTDLGTRAVSAFQTSVGASGSQAVYIFFILSGLVIALPVLAVHSYNWFAYYPRRLVRLYVPVVAAILLSAALILAIPRDPANLQTGSWFLLSNIVKFDPLELLRELTLQGGSFNYDGPAWSLKWEVLFSIELPFFVVLAVFTKRWWLGAIVACLALNVAGTYAGLDVFFFLPMFLIGAIMAVNLEAIQASGARLYARRWSGLVTPFTLVVAALLFLSRVLIPDSIQVHKSVEALTATGWLLAGLLVVLLAVVSPGCARLLERFVPQWLGKVSFSLYLIHFPILATLTFIFGQSRWYLVWSVGLPLTLVFSYVFYRFVEKPSHRLSHRVGRWGAAVRDRFSAERSSLRSAAEIPISSGETTTI